MPAKATGFCYLYLMRIRAVYSNSAITEQDQRIAKLSNALGHPVRVALVRYLREKNGGQGVDNVTCNKDLVALFGYSQSAISQHVKILKDCGFFLTEKKDKFTHYFLNQALLDEYQALIRF